MARAGIQYFHVLEAAQLLSSEGKNPTVDSVREAMGGTGSKSTIAPLLKRWKLEHQSEVATAQSGLPEPLLQVVKGLHQHMLAQVEQQLAQAQLAHAAEMSVMQGQAQECLLAQQAALAANGVLSKELEAVWQDLLQLQVEHQAQCVVLAGTQADKAGLQQRLADRAAEVVAVNLQLAQFRAQFEHYQEAAANQRTQERQVSEQRLAGMTQELLTAQRAHAAQQTALGRQEAQLTRCTQDTRALEEDLRSVREILDAARLDRERLFYQLDDMTSLQQRTADELKLAHTQLVEAKVAQASDQRERELQAEQLRRVDARADQLAAQHIVYVQELAVLRQQLEQARPAPDPMP